MAPSCASSDPGDVLGELALLTGEQRSAGVRARRDSTVLEVPRDAFAAMLETDLVGRTDGAHPGGRAPAHRRPGDTDAPAAMTQPGVVAVVGLHPGSGCAEVADVLGDGLPGTCRWSSPGVVGPDGLERGGGRARPGDPGRRRAESERGEGMARLLPATGRRGRAGRPQRRCGARRCAGSGAVPPARPRAGRPRSRPGAARGVGRRHRRLAADLRRARPGRRPACARRPTRRSVAGPRARAAVVPARSPTSECSCELADSGLHVDRVAGSSIGAVVAALHAPGMDSAELEQVCYAEFVRRNALR